MLDFHKCKRIASKVSKCKFKFYFCIFMDINCHVFVTVTTKCKEWILLYFVSAASSDKKVCVPFLPCGECQSNINTIKRSQLQTLMTTGKCCSNNYLRVIPKTFHIIFSIIYIRGRQPWAR